MSLLTTTRRAEQFAALLDPGARTDDPVAAPLTALATALANVPSAARPREEFRSALRQRLVAVATVQPPATAAHPSPVARLREAGATWRFQRTVAALAGGAAAITALVGVGLGASRSLPGDPFYGLKRATERVQLATAQSPEAKGRRHLEFARTRLVEVEQMTQSSAALGPIAGLAGAAGALTPDAQTSAIVATLADMDAETRAGASDLWTAFRSSGSAQPLQVLNGFTRTQYADLGALIPALPVSAQPRARTSLALLRTVAVRTASVAATHPGSSGTAPSSTTPAPGTPTSPTSRSSATPTGSPSTGGNATTSPTAPSIVPTTPPPAGSNVVPPIVPTIPPLTSLVSPSPTAPSLLPTVPLPTAAISSLLPPLS